MTIAKNMEFQFIQLAKEGTEGDTVDYLGYVEAKLLILFGKKMFETNALLLVLPTTE